MDNPLAAKPACVPVVAASSAAGSTNFPGAEVEPYVSADPVNPNHLVASLQQDRWNDGGPNGLTNVVSYDGGTSWKLAVGQPKFSICEIRVSTTRRSAIRSWCPRGARPRGC